MENWRESILKEFTPQVARITVVADPDELISEEVTVQQIQSRGFDLVLYEDPVSFRYLYEAKYRLCWESGGTAELVVVLRDESYKNIPYDVLSGARKLTFSLDRLFPEINKGVLHTLDRGLLDALYQAQAIYTPQHLSENATKDFILRHVFEIAPEMVKTPADLLRVLLRKHYSGQRIPAMLDEWLIQMLHKSGRFSEWPLEMIVPDRAAFLSFLQERWPTYLHSIKTDQATLFKELSTTYHPTLPGPALLPFDHNDVRVYIDNLFAEGWLKPVSLIELNLPATAQEFNLQHYPTWARMGIHSDPEAERQARLQKILQVIEGMNLQPEAMRHTDWIGLASKWAEANFLWHSGKKLSNQYNTLLSKYNLLRKQIDEKFTDWMQLRFGSLYNLTAADPVMVHHIPRFISKELQASGSRAALIIIDGMAFDQWVAVRDILQRQLQDLQFSVTGAFAWVPTLTSVSRQSIFGGKPPMFFPDRIWDTNSENTLWSQFWTDSGLAEYQNRYIKLTGKINGQIDEISDPKVRVLGIVIDKVDKIMHGMELGSAGMINQVQQWTEQGDMSRLIQLLIQNNFRIFISSDHGNIEATGCGRPGEGSTADLRGERVRVYPNEALRSSIHDKFPQSLEWKPVGLPAGYFPLMALNRSAFVQQDKHVVSHGGISLEEVIVPFIKVEKR
jgi:hypothetical protein